MRGMRRRGRKGGHAGGGVRRSSTPSSRVTQTPQPTTRKTVDLNSRSETTVANIVFHPVTQHNFPIVQFECFNLSTASESIREWLQETSPLNIQDFLRLDDQELNLNGHVMKGILTLLESAATLEGNTSIPVSILALHLPNNTRFHFFWAALSPSPLLTDLTVRDLIGPPQAHSPNGPQRLSTTGTLLPPHHHTLYTILKENSRLATTYPDAPAFRTASLISDWCPRIRNPADACRRIEAAKELNYVGDSVNDGKDLGDDRYIFEVEPAERALAGLVYICCSEYLLLKRNYFKAFSRDCVINSHKIRRSSAWEVSRRSASADAEQDDDGSVEDDDDDDDEEGEEEEVDQTRDDGNDDENDDYDSEEDNDDDNEEYINDATHKDSPTRTRNDTPTSTPIALTTRSHDQTNPPNTTNPKPNRKTKPATSTIRPRTRTRRTAAQSGARSRRERVRTVNGHIRAVQAATNWSYTWAKKLVAGWEVLGFLDERRVLDVVMGEESGSEDGWGG